MSSFLTFCQQVPLASTRLCLFLEGPVRRCHQHAAQMRKAQEGCVAEDRRGLPSPPNRLSCMPETYTELRS